MAAFDNSLDIDLDNPVITPHVVPNKRKKVIGLDDLLADFYQEKAKSVENESKRLKKAPKKKTSDRIDPIEASLSKLVDQCQNQMIEMGGEEENSVWGIQLFGDQKCLPHIATPSLENCELLGSFVNNELNSLIELSSENGETFIEGLLVSGWLTKLVVTNSHAEESILKWGLNLMLYSPKEDLRTSACNFWCTILAATKESNKIDWFPSYSDLRKALEVYGFVPLSDTGASSVSSYNSSLVDSSRGRPYQNIRSWIKFVTVSCQLRSRWSAISTSEAEELVEIIICLFLDRQLQGLSLILYECMQTLIGYFTNEEWEVSCGNIAKYLAYRVPKDLNCIRLVECISGIDNRSKHLRSLVAYEILRCFFDNKASDDEILRFLLAINLKEKSCDVFKAYIYLVLTENWLLSYKLFEEKPILKEMWGLYLRHCNCMISSTDMRSYAPKIRDRASFLLQGATRL